MNVLETYEQICAELDYARGLVEHRDDASSPVQSHLFSEAQRQIRNIDAVYFSGDVPVIYFKRMTQFDEDKIKALHKSIWNQNRVPLLYVVTPGELRIYDCFQDPARPESQYELDAEDRLVKHFRMATRVLEELERFSRPQIDSGAFWKSQQGQHFHANRRVDYRLLERLRKAREELHAKGLDYPTIHRLLGRSIFIMYLEDRNIIGSEHYSQFLNQAETYPNVLRSVEATYQLFAQLVSKFNGDLFPVEPMERKTVRDSPQCLETIRDLLIGTEMETGQMALWRPWDFSIIPIELVSAIYEEFLRKEEEENYASETGAYYTPHSLVEFILNEVLPWPRRDDHQWELRVLDPACGSGIFLVEAFRRLVARWRFSHDTDEISPEELTNILTEYIYGIDISPDAVGVAAFSLYLALSDYLEPSEIWEGFQFPHLVYSLDDPESGGRNLFPMDTIPTGDVGSTEPFEELDYDIIVGNPPWKRNDLPENIADYCGKRGFAQEMAQAFLWRARDFTSKGKIALMAPSKTLVNIEKNDRNFRRELFEKNYVETVVNFSALEEMSGKDFFTSAAWPSCIFFYSPDIPDHPRSTILYCTPKLKASDSALPGIIIDASDIQFLPREKCATSDIIWKVALWATQRDFELIERLRETNTLDEYLNEENGWYWARGLQRPGASGPYESEDLAELPMVPTTSVGRYWLDRDKLEIIGRKYFYRIGKYEEIYYAPHLLLKRGPSKGRPCAVFADFDCAFKEAIYGIAAEGNRESHLKALTAYFNSSFVAYFLFLTAAMWGIERPRISKAEISNLPGVVFGIPEEARQDLAAKVERIQKLTFDGVSETDPRVRELQTEADEIIYGALGLSDAERILVEDVLKYVIGFFDCGDTSKGYESVIPDELIDYAEAFCHTVNGILQFGQMRASATVYAGEAPLRLVSVHFNTSQNGGTIEVQQTSEQLREVLKDLEKRTQAEYAENLYFRRNVKLYEAETLHIVKPDEKRFWTRSMALRDADEVLAEGIRES